MWVVPLDLVDTILSHYNETFALPQVSEGAALLLLVKFVLMVCMWLITRARN